MREQFWPEFQCPNLIINLVTNFNGAVGLTLESDTVTVEVDIRSFYRETEIDYNAELA